MSMMRKVAKETSAILLVTYFAFLASSVVAIARGWLEYPLITSPLIAVFGTLSILFSSYGAIATIPLGLLLSYRLKVSVLTLLSGENLTWDKTLKVLFFGFMAGLVLLGVSTGMGVLGASLFGEHAPRIEKIFVIPVANASLDLPWAIAMTSMMLCVGIAEEGAFRLFGIPALLFLLKGILCEERSWHPAIIITSLAFATIHLSLTMWETTLASTFLRIFLGSVVLGYLFKKVGYEACVIAHASSNVFGFAILSII